MANEIRRIVNFLGGELDAPLAAGATTLTNEALRAFPAVGSTEHMPLTFDPDGEEGAPFVKWVTAHTAGDNVATITAAAQEGTTDRAVSAGIPFVHAPTAADWGPVIGRDVVAGVTGINPNNNWVNLTGSQVDIITVIPTIIVCHMSIELEKTAGGNTILATPQLDGASDSQHFRLMKDNATAITGRQTRHSTTSFLNVAPGTHNVKIRFHDDGSNTTFTVHQSVLHVEAHAIRQAVNS